MKIIIRKATIIDAKSPFHNQNVDVKIANGIIEKIGQNIATADHYTEIELDNLHLSQGAPGGDEPGAGGHDGQGRGPRFSAAPAAPRRRPAAPRH